MYFEQNLACLRIRWSILVANFWLFSPFQEYTLKIRILLELTKVTSCVIRKKCQQTVSQYVGVSEYINTIVEISTVIYVVLALVHSVAQSHHSQFFRKFDSIYIYFIYFVSVLCENDFKWVVVYDFKFMDKRCGHTMEKKWRKSSIKRMLDMSSIPLLGVQWASLVSSPCIIATNSIFSLLQSWINRNACNRPTNLMSKFKFLAQSKTKIVMEIIIFSLCCKNVCVLLRWMMSLYKCCFLNACEFSQWKIFRVTFTL